MKKTIKIILAALAVFCAVNIIISCKWLYTRRFTAVSESLPRGFEGFRIVQVSDLHNARFGKGNSALLEAVKSENPDIIAITGDLIDDKTKDYEALETFLKALSDIAPCYYVTGNHEAEVYKDYFAFEKRIRSYIKCLHTASVKIERDGETILIQGIDDPNFTPIFLDDLEKLGGASGYKILLCHRPEKFPLYVENGFDLVLTGHTHGGQIRLPFIGAVVAPSQGFFPKYDAGEFSEGKTEMIVSRGLGSSVLPIRFFNRPEIVTVELSASRGD